MLRISADSDGAFDGHHNLDRMMLVGRSDPLTPSKRDEPAFPEIPQVTRETRLLQLRARCGAANVPEYPLRSTTVPEGSNSR